MSSYDTVLIAASTSALVALAIEWAAKPRLEARKERILDKARARRNVERQLREIVSISGTLEPGIPAMLSDADRRRLIKRLEDRRAAVIQASEALDASFSELFRTTSPRVRVIVPRMIGMAQGIALSGKLHQQAGRELQAVAGPVLNYYAYPRWLVPARRKALAQAELAIGLKSAASPPGQASAGGPEPSAAAD
jgi:hypothetical protein